MVKTKHIVGLTGGIASGKSVASKIFHSLGAYIIDADVIGREIYRPGSECDKKLKEAFPFAYSDGKLDRRILKEAVFSDEEKLKRLNALTHSYIFAEIQRQIKECDSEFVLVVVPLMFETGFDKFLDCVICVSSRADIRIERLKQRDNIDDRLALRIMGSQLSDEERERRSDYIIRNDAEPDELRQAVKEVYEKILQKT